MPLHYIRQQTVYLASATIAVLFGGAYFLFRKKVTVPKEWTEIGKVKKICIYPLKSGRRVELQTAVVTKSGFKENQKFDKSFTLRDRCFVGYREDNKEYLTARTYPKLELIEIDATDFQYVCLNAPNMRTLFVKIPFRGESTENELSMFRNEKIGALDCGDEAAQWLSEYILGKKNGLRLGYGDELYKRDISKLYKDYMAYYPNYNNDSIGLYTDQTTGMILNQASVDDLNRRLPKDSLVNSDYFRPNIVIEGPKIQPYEEDRWDWLKIGDVVVRVVMECTRCVATTVNPETGVRNTNREPLKTLRTYRLCPGPSNHPLMGSYIQIFNSGEIRIDDKVYLGKN